MNIKTQQQVLFNELCRACLRKSNNMRYMMDTTDETTKTLLTTFSCFLDKELKFNKLYPCYLCPTCEWKLRSSFEFRTLCLKSDQCITTILSQTNLIQSNLVIDVNAAPLPQSNKKSAAGHSQENQLDKGSYVPQTAIFKPTDQQLNNIEPPIKIKDEDTDDDLYYNAGAYDAIDKVEVIEVHDEELHYTDDKTATIPSISNQLTSMNQKKLCTAIKFECQLPWNAKRKTKKIRQRADENPKLKLSRYPREEVQVHIDAIEYKSNQELECLFCKTMCQGQRALCRHVTAAHMDKKSKWCSTCNKQVENLPVHKKDNHQDHLTCPFCDKKLSIVGKYKAHLQRHIVTMGLKTSVNCATRESEVWMCIIRHITIQLLALRSRKREKRRMVIRTCVPHAGKHISLNLH
ncbi:unnamed protein product [Acanthoscelides obtectus]|uniref:ZAD domain-containing protein n=1 Tax=Acanthoscelides obtectus TaxID=200917 RepID=A0A9P0KJ64_ACAOB|nr:unnamed protein product [Acanthoscelides obtectus]CAK1664268.1 hypothetical protein AOBTE_LOCUS24163 [Acanthoscelides obtectus]